METPLENDQRKPFKKQFPRQIAFHCTVEEYDYFLAVRNALKATDHQANFRTVFLAMARALINQGLFVPKNFDASKI